MNEENMKKIHPELAEYYQKGDCCIWIVKLRKQVSEKDKEIERLNNIINEIEAIVYADISSIDCRISIQEKLDKLKELKESDEK